MSDLHVIYLPERFYFEFHKLFTEQSQTLLNNETCKQIILDFAKVKYIDSSALGMMVLLHKKANNKNVRVQIRGAQGMAAEILKMSKMHKLYGFIPVNPNE